MVTEIKSAIRRSKDFGATRIKVLYTNSGVKASSLEKYLIKKYNPPNNYTNYERALGEVMKHYPIIDINSRRIIFTIFKTRCVIEIKYILE